MALKLSLNLPLFLFIIANDALSLIFASSRATTNVKIDHFIASKVCLVSTFIFIGCMFEFVLNTYFIPT